MANKKFKKIISVYKKILHIIGSVQNFILLTVMYFIVIGLVSIVSKIARRDFLNARPNDKDRTFWKDSEKISCDFKDFLHQF